MGGTCLCIRRGRCDNTDRRVRFDGPSYIGLLGQDLDEGPVGRWDEASVLEIYMPRGALAGRSASSVLEGANRILVEHDQGWELIGWREGDLAGEDRWTLRGLLRGLSGSPVAKVLHGRRVVLLDGNVLSASLSLGETGLLRQWKTDRGELIPFTYHAARDLAWRVGHLKAVSVPEGWQLSWTRTGFDISDSWDLPEVESKGNFRIETWQDDVLLSSLDVEQASALIAAPQATLFRVVEISADGRPGLWSSIPV